MEPLKLDEKNREQMDAIRKFTLMDDTFMTQVFADNPECTEELLRIILKRNDLKVTRAVTQLTIGNLFGRSVRLDVYATDDSGKQYDIEVQQEDKGAAPERARLNSAMFDSHLTGKILHRDPGNVYHLHHRARCTERWLADLYHRADDSGNGKAVRRPGAYPLCEWRISWQW